MPPKKNTPGTIPTAKFERYKNLVSTVPGLELKGATMPYTSVNGNMSSFLDKNGNLAIRLDAEKRQAFISSFNTVLAEQHGIVLKEYVLVPEEAFLKTAALKKYFTESFQYVKALKPKPAKR